jgi:hypothetical protein
MNNDTSIALREIQAESPGSLISRIITLQRKAEFAQQKMAMRLCVQLESSKETGLDGNATSIELSHHYSDKYIAVSCPWRLPGHEIVSGRYYFSPMQPVGVIIPQDIVLDRVLNFKACNPEYRDTPVWIDKLCINQEASVEKEMAVHSMDLVYQYSGCTLGLLFVQLDTLAQIIALKNLLEGKCADNTNNSPELLISVEEANPVLDLIEIILQDDWWHRAWIFQEEFLASANMILLLPCPLDLRDSNETTVDSFGNTSGEIEFHALNFRTEVTSFCLALSQHADKVGQDRCWDILRFARRYTSLYRTTSAGGPDTAVRAMSPAIFDDLGSRGITVPSDILAIAANCCRYTSRLSSKVLNQAGESLSVAILTLVLMNGEILRHDTVGQDILEKNIFKCLHTEKLHVHPPIQSSELIFIKYCRLNSLKMTSNGIITRGVLSRVEKSIKVKLSASEQDLYWESQNPKEITLLTRAEVGILLALARYLMNERHTRLAGHVKKFSEMNNSGTVSQFWCSEHMNIIMAKYICKAIAEHRPLWLACAHVPEKWTPCLGIFVPETPQDDLTDIFAFTSLESDNERRARGAKLARKNARFASLEVGFEPAVQIVPKRWMNGLSFFNSKDHVNNWMIPWPIWLE